MKTVKTYINEAAEVKRPKYCQSREAFFKKHGIGENDVIETFELDNSFDAPSLKSDLLKSPYLHEATKMYYVKFVDGYRKEYGLYFEANGLPMAKAPIKFSTFIKHIKDKDITVKDNDVLKDLYWEYKNIFNGFKDRLYVRRIIGDYIGEPVTSKDELMSMVYSFVEWRGSSTYNDGKSWAMTKSLQDLTCDYSEQKDLYNDMKRDLYSKEGNWNPPSHYKSIKQSEFDDEDDVMDMISNVAEELYKARTSSRFALWR